jgi:RNA polymerase sigma-70 factor (ECF subfamily)
MTGRDVVDEGEVVARIVPVAADARADAFLGLARLHLEASYRLARAILGNVAEAEDATHDAFVQAWRRWPTLRDPLRFEAWFDRILLNTCRDRLRRRRRWPVVDISDELHQRRLDPGIEAFDDRELIRGALSRMAPDDRVILALRYYLDLSVDDIARRLGIRPGTVKSRLHYALQRLHRTLDASDDGDPR